MKKKNALSHKESKTKLAPKYLFFNDPKVFHSYA